MTSLSIVIPVYNADKTIADLSRTLISLLADQYQLQIVLVNDFSQDASDAVAKALQAEFPVIITYARLSRNFGEHNAVMAGLNLAQGDYVVVMDDDFQNPPEEVPRLVEKIRQGFDVVYCQYPQRHDSLFRNFGSYLNGSMARVVLKKPSNLYLSSFKAMNRFLVEQIILHKTPNPYIDAIILQVTRNIGMLDVRHDPRRVGSSGYTLKKLTALWGDMIVSYSLIPLRLLAGLGAVLSLLGVYSMLEMLIRSANPGLTDFTDIEELSSISMFFRGFQLLATGIVGEYVGRIYLKLNQQPQFIIRELLSTSAPHGTAESGNRHV